MRVTAMTVWFATCLLVAGSAHATPLQHRSLDVGISSNRIKLGGVLDQTGRGAIVARPILGGYQLAVKEVNARGGVYGRKIDLVAESDNYDPSQTLPHLKSLVEASGVFAVLGVFGSDDAAVAGPYLEKRHVPFFDPIGGGLDTRGKHWIWQTEPDYAREGTVIAKYVARTLHARRVAVLYQVGVGETQLNAIRRTLPRYGGSVVGTAAYAATDSNLSGQVIKLRSTNPDIVILNGTPTPTAAFISYARLQAFSPREGFLANYPMGDPLWLALIGQNGEGNRVSSYADLTGKNKVAAAYRAAIDKYQGERYSNYGLYGYFNATLFFKALKLAGKNLTRSTLQFALDHHFRHYDTGFTGRINWTATQHYGSRQFKIYQIRDRAFVPVTGWLNP